jgi:hypothetical protein
LKIAAKECGSHVFRHPCLALIHQNEETVKTNAQTDTTAAPVNDEDAF